MSTLRVKLRLRRRECRAIAGVLGFGLGVESMQGGHNQKAALLTVAGYGATGYMIHLLRSELEVHRKAKKTSLVGVREDRSRGP